MKSVTFVYTGKCHPVTQSLADITCDYTVHIKKLPLHGAVGPIQALLKGFFLKKSDNYFCESAMSVIVPMTRRHFLREKNFIIYRGIDGLFYDKDENYLGTKNIVKKWLLLKIIKNIDYVICDSTMVMNDAKKYGKNTVVCGSYTAKFDDFNKITPNLKSNIFTSVSDYRPPYDHKGVVELIELFNKNGLKLNIIGKDTDKLTPLIKSDNIKVLGFQKNPFKFFKESTFYIHMPKYEAGPISVIEAATVGLIPLVNEYTGFKDLVYKIDENLIIKGKDIKKILKMNYNERLRISKKAKKASLEYKKDRIMKKFKETFERIVNEHWRKHGESKR
jgi:hypothetical protein